MVRVGRVSNKQRAFATAVLSMVMRVALWLFHEISGAS